MAPSYSKHVSTRETPQTESILDKVMVPNSAGGFSFAVDKWKRLERFLVLGAEDGTYYISERKLVIENAGVVLECLKEDTARTVAKIVEISDAGRAPKNDPAVFALAIAAAHGTDKSLAMAALPKVCRIGTHLFQFAESVQAFRGWGRGLRKGVASWYTSKTPEDLSYQVVKYQQRNGWSHKDLLRLSHPSSLDEKVQAVFRWILNESLMDRKVENKDSKGTVTTREYPGLNASYTDIITAFDEAKTATKERVIQLILEHNLPRECIQTEHLNDPGVWDALLQKMPLNAMVRNLGKMCSVGLLTPMSVASGLVCSRLSDRDYIHKSRLHPMAILIAAKVYGSGKGIKGSLTWNTVSQVNDALDAAFYLSFDNVVPANKRTLMGLDVSGSMSSSISGSPLSCAEGAAAMAMVQAKTEPQYQLMAFADIFKPLDISKCSRLTDVLSKTTRMNFGATDCSLPMLWAELNKVPVDTFIVLTDSESYAGKIHASQALTRYREKTGIPSRAICVGMTANQFSILDPDDAGSLNVVGFDTSVPEVMANFSRGDI